MADTDKSRSAWGKRTVCLLVAYILCGMVLSILCGLALRIRSADHSWRHLTRLLFFVVVGSQEYLLIIWAWLGTPSLRTRVVGVLVGTVYLAILGVISYSFPVGTSSRLLLSTVLFAIQSFISLFRFALIFGLLRLALRGKFELVKDTVSLSEDRFQYSIRHLLWLTTIVAVVLALGQISRSYFKPIDLSTFDESTFFTVWIVQLILSIPCSALLVFASAWAGFGSGSLLPRTAILCLLAAAVGLVFPYYLPSMDQSQLQLVTRALANVLMVLLVVAWLSVFRSRGYRFVASQHRTRGN